MHELSVCQSLFTQAAKIATENGAETIERIVVSIGPLSGVEPALLDQAFLIARADAGFPEAKLEIESLPVRVQCANCGAESDAAANRLLCGACESWHVRVVQGDEMILKSIELGKLPSPATVN